MQPCSAIPIAETPEAATPVTELGLQASTAETPTCRWGPGAKTAVKLYEREIAAYLRALPHLIEEGRVGHHALVKGDEVVSVWETEGDAIQAGRDRFGLEPIFVKTIDPRDPENFALLAIPREPGCQP